VLRRNWLCPKTHGEARDKKERCKRTERVLIDRLKAMREPMPEMGRHPIVPAFRFVLIAVRRKIGLSCNGLAEVTGIRRPTIADIEEGAAAAPCPPFRDRLKRVGTSRRNEPLPKRRFLSRTREFHGCV
jgi:hypothetical protein